MIPLNGPELFTAGAAQTVTNAGNFDASALTVTVPALITGFISGIGTLFTVTTVRGDLIGVFLTLEDAQTAANTWVHANPSFHATVRNPVGTTVYEVYVNARRTDDYYGG